jgi:hypothetical protein
MFYVELNRNRFFLTPFNPHQTGFAGTGAGTFFDEI